MSEWQKVRLGDICNRVTSGGTPLTSVPSYYFPKQIPWLKTAEVNYCRIYNTESYISKEGLEHSSAKLIPANSVIVAMYGQGDTAGRVAINKIPLATNQACCNLLINPETADYEYVYYALCTLYDKLVLLKNGGAQPNLSARAIKAIEIPLPGLHIQKRIAGILSAYDSLIENNRKQIRLLEEAARRLYKEWFVDFRFPGYESVSIIDGVPEGWKQTTIDAIVPIITGKKDANFGTSNGLYPFFTCAQEPIKAPSFSFDDSAVILAGNGDFNVKIYRGKFEAYQRTYVLVPYETEHLFLLFHVLNQNMQALSVGASGSTIKFLTRGMIGSIQVLIPDALTLISFNQNCEALQRKLENAKAVIQFAQEARDRLLPKLMSGELEV